MAQEQTTYVGDNIKVLVNVIDSSGTHVAAVINTTTTRLNGLSAAPTITTIATGIYEIVFSGVTPAPAEGDRYTCKVNGTISGVPWSEYGIPVKIVADERGTDGVSGGLDAAGVRTALGLSSANLDTQLSDIPTTSEFNARTLASADYFDFANDAVITDTASRNASKADVSSVSSDVTAILADTNELQGNQGDWATATGFNTIAPDNASISAILADTNELQTNQGDWLTATGFATVNPDNTSISLILADTNELQQSQGDWVTATGFNTVAPDNTSVAAIKTKTDSLTFTITNQVDSNALSGGLDAAGVRSAVGLASADLDTQLSDIPTASDILAAGDVDGYSLEETLKICLAALAGKISGAGTGSITIRSADDTKSRIVATTDSLGNRLSITIDKDD